jgi:hypothetical protein
LVFEFRMPRRVLQYPQWTSAAESALANSIHACHSALRTAAVRAAVTSFV